jgi:hypothetical protein
MLTAENVDLKEAQRVSVALQMNNINQTENISLSSSSTTDGVTPENSVSPRVGGNELQSVNQIDSSNAGVSSSTSGVTSDSDMPPLIGICASVVCDGGGWEDCGGEGEQDDFDPNVPLESVEFDRAEEKAGNGDAVRSDSRMAVSDDEAEWSDAETSPVSQKNHHDLPLTTTLTPRDCTRVSPSAESIPHPCQTTHFEADDTATSSSNKKRKRQTELFERNPFDAADRDDFSDCGRCAAAKTVSNSGKKSKRRPSVKQEITDGCLEEDDEVSCDDFAENVIELSVVATRNGGRLSSPHDDLTTSLPPSSQWTQVDEVQFVRQVRGQHGPYKDKVVVTFVSDLSIFYSDVVQFEGSLQLVNYEDMCFDDLPPLQKMIRMAGKLSSPHTKEKVRVATREFFWKQLQKCEIVLYLFLVGIYLNVYLQHPCHWRTSASLASCSVCSRRS